MKVTIYLICVTALASTALMFSRSALGADLIRVDWVVAALPVLAALAGWRFMVRRRQKERLEQMRDSALW
jgi:hypothetical protein